MMWVKNTTSRLPAEYQEVEYIESSGTQYINTGWYPSSNYCKTVMDATIYTGNSSWSVYYGMTNGSSGYSLHTNHSTRQLNVGSNQNKNTGISFSNGTNGTFTFEANNGSISVDIAGSTYTGSYSGSVFQSTRPFYIFAFDENGSPTWLAKMRVNSFKIYSDANTIERDFVPCYRKADSVIGMYDLVNNTFYTNQGSGTFTKGADIPDIIEKQVRPSGWTPGANTLWYINMNQSDAVFTDTQGHTVNNNGITYNASGVSEGCGFNNSNGKRLYSDFNTGESFPSNFTIMGFMKPANNHFTTDHPMGIVLSDQANERLRGIGWDMYNRKAQFSFLQENVAWATYEYNATDSGGTRHERHHYALTYDGTTMIGYIDGIQVVNGNVGGSGQGAYPLNGFSLFGRERSDQGFTNTIYGYVDEAICEDKVWTAQEIQDYLANFTY